jgi:transposase
MNKTKPTMAQQIAQAAIAFEHCRTGNHGPRSVTVVLSEGTLVITLDEALSPAERALAKSPAGAAQIQEFHRQLLPVPEAERLEQLFHATDDRKLRDRLQVVLMAHRGRARQEIAQDLGIHRRSVTRWLNAYCDAGLHGLRPRKAKGNPPKIPAAMADDVRRLVIEGPAKQGLDRANWTHEELADYLLKAHGIATSRSAVQRFCQRVGIRVYRPTYRYLRGDPQKRAQAKQEVADL